MSVEPAKIQHGCLEVQKNHSILFVVAVNTNQKRRHINGLVYCYTVQNYSHFCQNLLLLSLSLSFTASHSISLFAQSLSQSGSSDTASVSPFPRSACTHGALLISSNQPFYSHPPTPLLPSLRVSNLRIELKLNRFIIIQ